MASSLTAFREAVQAYLAEQLDIPFESGMITGPVEDRTVGCAWTAGVKEWEPDVLLEEIALFVRIFLQWQQPAGLSSPGISALEELAEALQEALKPVQTTLGPWQFRLVQVEIDLETAGIEGTIVAIQANPFGMGG